jgi:hypothetical protein
MFLGLRRMFGLPSWFVATVPYVPCVRLLFAQISVLSIFFSF